jgi:hypothetical protein
MEEEQVGLNRLIAQPGRRLSPGQLAGERSLERRRQSLQRDLTDARSSWQIACTCWEAPWEWTDPDRRLRRIIIERHNGTCQEWALASRSNAMEWKSWNRAYHRCSKARLFTGRDSYTAHDPHTSLFGFLTSLLQSFAQNISIFPNSDVSLMLQRPLFS